MTPRHAVLYDTTIDNCCIGGYHAARPDFQTYSPSNIDTTGFFVGAPDAAMPECGPVWPQRERGASDWGAQRHY